MSRASDILNRIELVARKFEMSIEEVVSILEGKHHLHEVVARKASETAGAAANPPQAAGPAAIAATGNASATGQVGAEAQTAAQNQAAAGANVTGNELDEIEKAQ